MALKVIQASKVVGFGTNRKYVCNILLVINSNPDHVLIATTSHSMQNLRMFPLYYSADVEASKSEG